MDLRDIARAPPTPAIQPFLRPKPGSRSDGDFDSPGNEQPDADRRD
jgi:hypothetical protein